MPYNIVIGRSEADKKRFDLKGTIFMGKQYIKMGRTRSLSNRILFDVATTHIVFICGKRGSGKSYTMGVIAEGISSIEEEVRNNLAVLIFDTMGIYWTMKYPNHKDEAMLRKWGTTGKALNIQLYTPVGLFKDYKDKGVPTDFPFGINPAELDPSDWLNTFSIDESNPLGIFIVKTINMLKKTKKSFSINDIIDAFNQDKIATPQTKDGAINRFKNAANWGLFSTKSTPITDLISPGQISVIDISSYTTIAGAEGVRALVIGLVSQKLFKERMTARATEEYASVNEAVHYFSSQQKNKKQKPLVWIMVDEAHEFLPNDGSTAATKALITILREGRQPGISLVLASQQPGKIHTDVMTQADTVIAHRLTAKIDVDALGTLMQSYMREGLDQALDDLPRVKGAAIIFDDINERMYPVQIRPRSSWHGGEAPKAVMEKKKVFEF